MSDNELLVELAGRTCYHSYGKKAGRKTNHEYIAHSQSGTVPHRSILYHAKMSFFVGGVSKRLTHELIRHYVGADRSEEGSPSQESSRYTFHPGHFIVPPKVLDQGPAKVEEFREAMQSAYNYYCHYVNSSSKEFEDANGHPPKGIDRKRIYEAAAGFAPVQVATSLVWTANPTSLAKMFLERTDESSDAEFHRLADFWKKVCLERWPALFHG